MEPRQLFRDPDESDPGSSSLVDSEATRCFNYALDVGGYVTLANGDVIQITEPAVYRPVCTPNTRPAIIANGGAGGTLSVDQTSADDNTITDLPARDPFMASTFPQCYALAATTVTAWMLVIMLFITPRSFLDGGVVVLGRRGFTNGGSGGTNIGGRPWLQKVAAFTVSISLTIATANTFIVAEKQYSQGIQNAVWIQQEVQRGTELKVIRIISGTFLWLAQAQTLIRLFPRQREKIIIKWGARLVEEDASWVDNASAEWRRCSRTGGGTEVQPRQDTVPTTAIMARAARTSSHTCQQNRHCKRCQHSLRYQVPTASGNDIPHAGAIPRRSGSLSKQ